MSIRNTLRLAHIEDRGWWRLGARTMSLPPVAGEIAGYAFFPLALLALVGAATMAARRAPPLWLWLVPLLLLIATVPIVGEIRMRAPIDPFLVLLSSLALSHGWERVRLRRPAWAPALHLQDEPE